MYARIKDSAVVGVYRNLPRSYAGISGFHTLDVATLAGHGFVPLIRDKPSYNPATQRLVGPTRTVEADRVVDVWTVEDIPLADLRTAKRAEVTALRYTLETGGCVWGGIPIATDRESRTNYGDMVLMVDKGLRTENAAYKFGDGVFRPLANADVLALAGTAAAHVQACFDAEEAHHATIDTLKDAASLAAYDTRADHADAPWPVAAPQDEAA